MLVREAGWSDQVFQECRANFRQCVHPTAELARQLALYAGWPPDDHTSVTDSVKRRDAFLVNLLLCDQIPEVSWPREQDLIGYHPTPISVVFNLVAQTNFQQHDVFIDIGSGLGHVVLLVHLLTGVRSRGIERDPSYWAYACRCAQVFHLNEVQFIQMDARDYHYAEETVFFLYSPFAGIVLQQVLQKLRLAACQRRIRIGTFGPCTEHVAQCQWLIRLTPPTPESEDFALFGSADKIESEHEKSSWIHGTKNGRDSEQACCHQVKTQRRPHHALEARPSPAWLNEVGCMSQRVEVASGFLSSVKGGACRLKHGISHIATNRKYCL